MTSHPSGRWLVALASTTPGTKPRCVDTLAASPEHTGDLMRYDSLAGRLIRLKEETLDVEPAGA